MSLLPRAFYFAIGSIFGAIFVSTYFASHIHQKPYPSRRPQEQSGPNLKQPLKTDDMVGTWHGKDGWGLSYIITRKEDGTFFEVLDFKKTEALHKPSMKAKGYWSVAGSQYAYYYTEADDPSFVNHHPQIFTITDIKPGELNYEVEEGCWTTECKE